MKIIKIIIGTILVMFGTSGFLDSSFHSSFFLSTKFGFDSWPLFSVIIGAMFLISADTKTYKNYYSKLKRKEKIK